MDEHQAKYICYQIEKETSSVNEKEKKKYIDMIHHWYINLQKINKCLKRKSGRKKKQLIIIQTMI